MPVRWAAAARGLSAALLGFLERCPSSLSPLPPSGACSVLPSFLPSFFLVALLRLACLGFCLDCKRGFVRERRKLRANHTTINVTLCVSNSRRRGRRKAAAAAVGWARRGITVSEGGRTDEHSSATRQRRMLSPFSPPALTRSLSVGFPHSLITSSSSSSSSWASFVQSPLLTAIDRTNDLPIILQPVLPLLNVVANNNQQLN